MEIQLPAFGWSPRAYQAPLWSYLIGGGKHAVAVWHRRAGKDEVALHWTALASNDVSRLGAMGRVGNYWHMLPEYSQARKAIWDAINPHSGRRRIDEAFPQELRKTTRNQEMVIEFHTGSIWQVVGSDNYNSLVGSPPVGVVYSEWALADPMAHAYLAPILAENNGWGLWIYTARGYNHGFTTYEGAKRDPKSFAELLTVEDTKAISLEQLESARRTYVDLYGPESGDAFYRQEFFNDWSAANVGAVLGPAVERAEKKGRIVDFELDDWPVEISSDIGFRDTAAWWFWQPKSGGFDLVDYDQGTGMDADDWIERLKAKPYRVGKIWLPHDARAKTFQSRHSTVERFIKAFGAEKVGIVPQAKVGDRINAARRVIEGCRFHRTNCEAGLKGLRSWAYEWDEKTKTYGKDPKHDWASHPGDGYSYGCQVMEERQIEIEAEEEVRSLVVGQSNVTLNDMWDSVRPLSQRI